MVQGSPVMLCCVFGCVSFGLWSFFDRRHYVCWAKKLALDAVFVHLVFLKYSRTYQQIPAPCGSAVQGAVLLSWMVARHGHSMAYACSRLHILQNLNGCTRLFDDRGFDYDLYMHISCYEVLHLE